MKATLSAAIAALESAAIALAVYALLCVIGFALWWFTFDLAADPQIVLAAASGFWMLGHFEPLRVILTPDVMLSLGLAPEALTFLISFAPLGVALMTVSLAMRMGARSAIRGGSGIAVVPGGILGFTAATAVIRFLAQPFLENQTWSAAVVPSSVFAVSLLAGFLWGAARQPHRWWQEATRFVLRLFERVAPIRAAKLPTIMRAISQLTFALGAGLVVLCGIGIWGATTLGYVDIVALSQSLQLNAFGVLVLFVLNLLLLPNTLVWAAAWFSGVGFSVSSDSFFSPFVTTSGSLPPLPLIGALPNDWGWASVLAPALVVCISVCVGALHAGLPEVKRFGWISAVSVPLSAAVIIGLAAAVLGFVSGGAYGPGVFSEAGVPVWRFAGLLAAEVGAGALLGSLGRRVEFLIREPAKPQRSLINRADFTESLAETVTGVPVTPRLGDPTRSDQAQKFTSMSTSGDASDIAAPATTSDQSDDTDQHVTEELIRKYAWNPPSTNTDITPSTTTSSRAEVPFHALSELPHTTAASADDTVPLDPLKPSTLDGTDASTQSMKPKRAGLAEGLRKWRKWGRTD